METLGAFDNQDFKHKWLPPNTSKTIKPRHQNWLGIPKYLELWKQPHF